MIVLKNTLKKNLSIYSNKVIKAPQNEMHRSIIAYVCILELEREVHLFNVT